MRLLRRLRPEAPAFRLEVDLPMEEVMADLWFPGNEMTTERAGSAAVTPTV